MRTETAISAFAHSSRGRLTPHDLGRFTGHTLFDRLARALCDVGCLPRKELYEAWEVARRVRRVFRRGRVIDLAGGHGLLGQAMLLIGARGKTTGQATHGDCLIVVDKKVPPSAARVHETIASAWPALADRVEFAVGDLTHVPIRSTDIVVSNHACGRLTDAVIDLAIAARARVAVLPCCHDVRACDTGPFGGWLDGPLAIDVRRATRLEAAGYHVRTQTIPADITPKNRLLIGEPLDRAAS